MLKLNDFIADESYQLRLTAASDATIQTVSFTLRRTSLKNCKAISWSISDWWTFIDLKIEFDSWDRIVFWDPSSDARVERYRSDEQRSELRIADCYQLHVRLIDYATLFYRRH